MSDLNFQNLSTVQNNSQPMPVTITPAATIAPTTFLTVMGAGNTAIATITPPVTGSHMLAIVPATTTGFTSSGNISGGTTTVAGRAYLFVYNPLTATYYLVSSTTS
jgi:hypothetical protein